MQATTPSHYRNLQHAATNTTNRTTTLPTKHTTTQPPPQSTRPALRGDGDYAGACCGKRVEVIKAGVRWYFGMFAMHEVDAGVCYATGCNAKAIDFNVAGGCNCDGGDI